MSAIYTSPYGLTSGHPGAVPAAWCVMSIPALVIIKDKKLVSQAMGARPNAILAML